MNSGEQTRENPSTSDLSSKRRRDSEDETLLLWSNLHSIYTLRDVISTHIYIDIYIQLQRDGLFCISMTGIHVDIRSFYRRKTYVVW